MGNENENGMEWEGDGRGTMNDMVGNCQAERVLADMDVD